MLQADLLMRETAHKDRLNGQSASTRFLSGVIYELGKEWDDALIAYRKAANLMDERQQKIPDALQQSLLRMTRQAAWTRSTRTMSHVSGAKPVCPGATKLK